MNKTFAFLMTLFMFYGIGGGGVFYTALSILEHFSIGYGVAYGFLIYIVYVGLSFIFLFDLAGT